MPADPRPNLVDRAAILSHRRRAIATGAPALFLHDEAMAEVEERLATVNRTFTSPAIVTGFPEAWGAWKPYATVVADDDTLALTPGAHDVVIHAMALHAANDPVGQIIQARRALAPDGLFIAVTLGGQTLTELRQALAEAEIAHLGGLSPRVMPMGDVRDLGSLLQRAGLAMPVADGFVRHVSYASPLHLMRDLRAMGEANAMADRARGFTPRGLLTHAAQIYADAFGTDDGRVIARFEIITLTGWSPGPDQPQPLRPGSAAHRLADALETHERPLPDRTGD